MRSSVRRRLISIPAVVLAFLAVAASLPATVPLCAIAALFPGSRGALRSLCFLTSYLAFEVMGLAACAWLWIQRRLGWRDHASFIAGNYSLQRWWASGIKNSAARLFRVTFDIDGSDQLPGPAILVARHASIADTVLPITLYAAPHDVRLRYVLKRELLWDPCLDIVGNRLPNVFIERGTGDPQQAALVVALIQNLEPNGGVLIYPEGTRHTPAKREVQLARHQHDSERLQQLERWPDLLPPRMGGVRGLFTNNPGLDALFCAHVGFEGSTDVRSLISGAWMDTRVQVEFWRVPFADLPTEPDDVQPFMFSQWDRMQQTIKRLEAVAAPND